MVECGLRLLISLLIFFTLVACDRPQSSLVNKAIPTARASVRVSTARVPSVAAAADETASLRLIISVPVERFPPGCHPDEVTQLVIGFVEAFNRGDQTQLAHFFPADNGPRDRRLEWYSVTDKGLDGKKRDFTAYDRKSLLHYFQERQRQHEQLQLRELGVTPGSLGDVGIGYTLTRRADDIPSGLGGPEQLARGKGGIDCATRTIFLWSMGQGP